MFKSKQIDATQGRLVPQIILFVVPLILSSLVQKLFNAVDIAVLGNMADTRAVASVGATTTIVHLIVDAFVGIAAGSKIVLSRLVGKNDEKELRRAIDTSLVLAVVFGLLVAIVGFIMAPFFLRWVGCPTECFDGAVLYIRLYLAAAPAILLYNYGSAVLTSSGDTKRPLYYSVASGCLNVVLNIVLCLILPQKVAAVAIATAASQILAAILVMIRLCHLEGALRVRIRRIRFYFQSFVLLIRFGVPVALVNLIYPFANLQIASAINSHGVACMAGNSAAQTMEQMVATFRAAFGVSTATFMGQNLGAEKHDRVRKSFWHHMWLVAVVNTVIAMSVMLLNPFWPKIFLGDDAAAIEYAVSRNNLVMVASIATALSAVISHAIQAFGYPIFGTLNAVIWVLGLRTVWMTFVYPTYPTYMCLIQCFAVTWILSMLSYAVIFFVIYRRYRKGKYKHI